MARYTSVDDTDIFRSVIEWERSNTYHGPYDTIAAAKTQVKNGQKYTRKQWPGKVQQLVATVIPDQFEATLEWIDVAVLTDGIWVKIS